MTDVYGTVLTTIRAGAPGLSDATCEVIAQTIARKLKAPLAAGITEARDDPQDFDGEHPIGRRLEGFAQWLTWCLEGKFKLADTSPKFVKGMRDDILFAIRRLSTDVPNEPEWQAEAFAFLYGLIGGAPDTAANVIRKNPEVRARLHRAIYERRPREESYDAMMARLLPNGLPSEVEA